jgi:hydrogenase/urease accessory protein HupE
MTRKNRGVFEPEFRLPLVIPMMVFGAIGLFGFGITSNDIFTYGWFWPAFFFAFEVAGMVLGAVASSLYIVDAHRKFASVLSYYFLVLMLSFRRNFRRSLHVHDDLQERLLVWSHILWIPVAD